MKLTVVRDGQRQAFPGKHFHDPVFDIKVFNMANKLLKDYSGGYWEYIETDTNVAFMRLRDDDTKEFTLINPFSEEEINADSTLAGMIVTSYAMLYQIEFGNTGLVGKWESLNDAIENYCSETNRMDVWMTIMD